MNPSEMETTRTGRLRKLAAKFSNLSRPDGSAILAQGETVVQAGVYGPVEVKQMRELPEKATVEVFFRSKSGQQSCSDRMSEKVIRSTLETALLTALHPRSCISLTCQEFHNNGGLLACAINAACLAAIDAAVSMKCHIAAVTAAMTNTGIILLDPDGQQEQEARAVCTFSFESQDSKLVSTYTSGQFSKEEFQKCLALCQAAAGDIFAFYQDALQKRYCPSLSADSDSDDD
uniref:Putative exosomal 3'-5' exoribonuclease complex subunit rrp46 n=1 Tax=Rhipicephalus microplus TaxID=6941 RepID=A0A6G4ZX04_RHIMP